MQADVIHAAVLHAAGDLRVEPTSVPELGPRDVAVRVGAGGICGSDLHYFNHGGTGAIRLREPMILGHEIAGTVSAVGSEVTRVAPGQRVAVDPSRPCGACRFCKEGTPRHCLEMRFLGSAMRMPHVQGGFRQMLVCTEAQAVPVPDHVPVEHAAFAEPLAVCLHAVSQAGPLLGRRVLVTGAGPIGALCVMAARYSGAREIVATDVVDAPLATVLTVGADLALNTRKDPAALDRFGAAKGYFDVVFEASGHAAALTGAIGAARPGAALVLVGLGGDMALPVNAIVAKELELRGTFRFDAEFELAVDLIASGRIDVAPLLTEIVPLHEAVRAFELAGDRTRAMKVQLAL